MRFVFLTTLIFILGCGSATVSTQEPVPEPSAPEEVNTAPAEEINEITRENLNAIIEGGPGQLLSHLITEPYRENGKFIGFRFVAFTGTESDPVVDVIPGDVLIAVNKHPVEKPEHLMEIFEQLKTATEISFDILRNQEMIVLTYPVVD